MKILNILLCLIPFVGAKAQWTTGTNIYNQNSGNVGINIGTPSARLTVNGDMLVGGAYANLDHAANNAALNGLANTGQMLIGWNRTSGEGEADFINNRGAGAVGGFTFYDMANNGTIVNLMRISGNGNVGIGMAFPNEKLTVNGKIRSQEVVVETTNWPDYVFKPEYLLPKLSAIKSFISQNHHLPDLPSAQEVEKKGIHLGEINAKLLKKIEELTLHLIEKDEQIKAQQSRADVQEKRLAAIENRLAISEGKIKNY